MKLNRREELILRKRLDKRAVVAFQKSISRAIMARSQNPAGRMREMRDAKAGSLSEAVLMDRMKILNDAKSAVKDLHDEGDVPLVIRETQSKFGLKHNQGSPPDPQNLGTSPTVTT